MIVRTRSHGEMELRAGFALSDMARWGYQGLRNLTPAVGEKEMRGIPAFSAAARLRAQAVAVLGLYCWRGQGPTRSRVDGVWQARLFANPPNDQQTVFDFWETVEESLAYRGNGFVWKIRDPSTNRVVEWWALNPDQVRVITKDSYEVRVVAGFIDPIGHGDATYNLTGGDIIHFRGHGQGGQLLAPSPVQQFRDKMSAPIGRQRHEARMWRRGTAIQQAVIFPDGMSRSQSEEWRESWRGNYEGTEGETTIVLGGGAKLQPVGMTMQDAQFVEMNRLTSEDAAMIMGVPANLLFVQLQPRQDLQQDMMSWLRFGLGPELSRIEKTLASDPDLFGTSQTYPGFDTDGFVRGDLLTEAQIIQSDIQAGILTPNEGRALKGYGPIADGDILQITPVGGAPNPLAMPSPGDSPDDTTKRSREQAEEDMRPIIVNNNFPEQRAPEVRVEHFSADDRLVAALEARERPIVNIEQRDMVIPAPIVNVQVDAAPTPNVEVNVAAPNVQVDAPVTVQPAPVTVLPADDVDAPKKVTVERARNGVITSMTIEEA